MFDMGLLDAVVVGRALWRPMVAWWQVFRQQHQIPLIGIGVSRDPPTRAAGHKGAGSGRLAPDRQGAARSVSFGGYWQPKYSVLNAKMVKAVQMLARTGHLPIRSILERSLAG
jgi:D-cysteine desulfhydrase